MTAKNNPALGFIGLGDMGGAIAERIVEAGHALSVLDTRPDAVTALVKRGAKAGANVSALAESSDILFLCVVDDRQVLELARDHLVHSLRPGSLLVVLSSVRPDTMLELQALFATTDTGAGGVALLDAPVSGSRPAVAAGELTLMVGGAADDLERARGVLDSFAGRVFLTGAIGSGQAMKIANNLMLHMNHLIALEALRFARAQGISEETLVEIVNTSSGRSWVTENWGLIDNMFRDHPQAGSDGIYGMMVKEMWNALLLSRGSKTALPLTGLGVQISREYYVERERDLTA